MKPDWECDGVRLYLGDCESILPTIAKVDAVVTDPPYGVNGAILNPKRNTNGRRHNTWHDEPDWDSEIKENWCRLCSDASNVIAWFGNWRRRGVVEKAMPLPIRVEIVWAKDTHVGPPCPLAMQDERIWIFSQSGLKPTRFDTTVWSEAIIPTWAHRHHKNEKPVSLMERLVSLLTSNGQHVLDPFMGSGTTGVACVKLDRQFIGIEKEPKYFDIAVKRIEQAIKDKKSELPFMREPQPTQKAFI